MPISPLISAHELHERMTRRPAGTLVVDCGFDLTDQAAGRRAYEAGHLPGAVYVHLEDTLSGTKTGRNGRHPLPDRAAFARSMAALGADDDTFVVGYDNAGGMYAARLWWMLRWAGHAAVAVLDGGISAWKAEGLPLEQGTAATARAAGRFSLRDGLVGTIDYQGVKASLATGEKLVVDARAPDRFRGENETLDPVGGHIPGARNRPFRDNLAADGKFKSAAALRAEFALLFGDRPPGAIVDQCGSGVTACHNLLAQEVAGLGGALLYPGSWSEWCAQPDAPIATGAQG